MLQILKSGEIAHPTKEKISKFLNTNNKPDSKRFSKKKLPVQNENETPFKKIFSSNKSSEFKRSSPNRHKFGECGNNSIRIDESVKKKVEPKAIKKNLPSFSNKGSKISHQKQ